MLSFFLLATSLLSERMVSFDPLCGIAARKETMKLAGLRLRVIWTLPVFYYLNLGKIEIKNCAQVQEACDARLFGALAAIKPLVLPGVGKKTLVYVIKTSVL